MTHALLPAFVLAWRLDAAETIGTVVAGVASGVSGVRPGSAGGSAASDAWWKGHLISVGVPRPNIGRYDPLPELKCPFAPRPPLLAAEVAARSGLFAINEWLIWTSAR